MKRRQAIQRIAVMAGGLLALPAWAKGWTPQNLPAVQSFFSPLDQQVLGQIVDAILCCNESTRTSVFISR